MGTFYTIAEIAEALKVSERTVRRLIDGGEIRACKIGGAIRVPEHDLQVYLNRSRTASSYVVPATKRGPGRPAKSTLAFGGYTPGMKVV